MAGDRLDLVFEPAAGTTPVSVRRTDGALQAELTAPRLRHFDIGQGVEMSRPSRIRAAVDVSDGRVAAVRIAGTAVTVTDGWLHLA